jgi:retron-type reverse transcriptase
LKDLRPKNGQYVNLTKNFLSNPEFLKFAYYQIKKKPKNAITTINVETFDDFDNDWFVKLAKNILEGNYTFQDYQRIYTIKADKKQFRTIAIENSKNRIVQKAMQIILEEIFEKKESYFSSYSHGFRPEKSCHSALKQIKTN